MKLQNSSCNFLWSLDYDVADSTNIMLNQTYKFSLFICTGHSGISTQALRWEMGRGARPDIMVVSIREMCSYGNYSVDMLHNRIFTCLSVLSSHVVTYSGLNVYVKWAAVGYSFVAHLLEWSGGPADSGSYGSISVGHINKWVFTMFHNIIWQVMHLIQMGEDIPCVQANISMITSWHHISQQRSVVHPLTRQSVRSTSLWAGTDQIRVISHIGYLPEPHA